MSRLLDQVVAEGLGGDARERYAALLAQAHALLDREELPAAGRVEAIVPGRVELVGKHVDYAGGRSLTCPVDRGMVSVSVATHEPALVVHDVVRGEHVTAPLAHLRLAAAAPRPAWRAYVDAVAQRLAMNFAPLSRGATVALGSTLPPDAGLSSSTAFTITLVIALAEANGLPDDERWRWLTEDPLRLAGYCSAIESGADYAHFPGGGGVGTMSGTQDQCAILGGSASMVDQFAYRPERREDRMAWPSAWALLVAESGVVAAKGGGAQQSYNRAARVTARLVATWNARAAMPVTTLREVIAGGSEFESLAAAAETEEFPESLLRARLAQFDQECRIVVPTVARAIEAADPGRLARGVAHSVAGAVWALENQVPETLALTQLAVSAGAWCASPFGAGFGGSVWAIAPRAEAESIAADWRSAYVETGSTSGAGVRDATESWGAVGARGGIASVQAQSELTGVLTMVTMSKSQLTARLLEFLRQVETCGVDLVVTDRGVPVARIVPFCERRPVDGVFADLRGKLRWTGDLDAPTIHAWPDP
ncbi:MAG: hypothetical protein MUE41_09100 [Gemmatimonadaceae bacterium]|nr:hypothetical protein [Gemmatimonadaceae bacterium]